MKIAPTEESREPREAGKKANATSPLVSCRSVFPTPGHIVSVSNRVVLLADEALSTQRVPMVRVASPGSIPVAGPPR
jgi:hypothetical protein